MKSKAIRFLSVFLTACMGLGLAACAVDTTVSSGSESAATSSVQATAPNGVSAAYVVTSKYYTDRIIVAEVDATNSTYGADPTGAKDSTAAIQNALDYVAFTLKGGSVYLPAGKYRVEGRIILRTGTTLIGDYVDPDKVSGTDYGTMLMVYTDKRNADGLSVIQMDSDTALEGITVFYPEQKASDPVDYYYTIDSKAGANCRTIKNVTLLNSYYGITGPLNDSVGMATYTNVKGTVLSNAFYSFSESDICYYSEMSFAPSYWASMDSSFNPPKDSEIRSAMDACDSIGIKVINIDRSSFKNITLDGYTYGIYSDTPKRTSWCGSWYNLNIKDAEYGIYAVGISNAYGVGIANSSISGSKFALCNETSTSTTSKFCYIYLYNCKISGDTKGFIHTLTGDSMNYTEYSSDIAMPSSTTIYNLASYGADNKAAADSTQAIQKALDDAHANGGGIVYIPGGKYLINGSLTVYEGTMLMGSMYYSSSKGTYGTTLFAYATDKEIITVSGKNAGVVGLLIAYPENGVTEADYMADTKDYPFTISCTGANTYVKSVTIVATSKGVHFKDADNFIVDRLLMTVWDCGVQVENSDNGYIFGIHTNVGYALGLIGINKCFNGWLNTNKTINKTDTNAAYVIIDSHIRNTLTLFKVSGCKNLQLVNDFHYGAKNFAEVSGSSIFCVNTEASRLGAAGYYFSLTNNSTVKGVNLICYNAANIFRNDGTSSFKLGNINEANKLNYNK